MYRGLLLFLNVNYDGFWGNLPQVNVNGDRIFAVGGENNDRVIGGDHYAHYPQMALFGKVTVA
jgi:hypothetical protein